MVKLHFLHCQRSDVNHTWQLWSLDDCLPSLCVLWPIPVLFGCHGSIKFLNDISSKTTEAVWLLFFTNVAWVRTIQNSQNYGGLPLGLVAIATETSHRPIMGKGLKCIFFITSEMMWTIFGTYDHLMIVYPVCMFYDQWLFCLVAMATLNFKSGIFLNDYFFKTIEAV